MLQSATGSDYYESVELGLDGLYGVCMASVVPEDISWLWQGRIALGKVTILDGDPGLGKSMLSLDIASRISTGADMPDSSSGISGSVLLLTAEDGLEDTVQPRLVAAGADLSRIRSVLAAGHGNSSMPIMLPDHLDVLEYYIEDTGAKLVVIDPLLAYMSGGIDSYRDQDCREVMTRMAEVAHDTGVAILAVRHRRKASTGNPVYDGLGSIGIIGAARSGLLVAKSPHSDEGRILAVTKMNVGKAAGSYAFHVETADNGAGHIMWDGPISVRAEDLSVQSLPQRGASALEEATSFLLEVLSDGPVLAAQVMEEATKRGISKKTLDRARAKVATTKKLGLDGGWSWEVRNM